MGVVSVELLPRLVLDGTATEDDLSRAKLRISEMFTDKEKTLLQRKSARWFSKKNPCLAQLALSAVAKLTVRVEGNTFRAVVASRRACEVWHREAFLAALSSVDACYRELDCGCVIICIGKAATFFRLGGPPTLTLLDCGIFHHGHVTQNLAARIQEVLLAQESARRQVQTALGYATEYVTSSL